MSPSHHKDTAARDRIDAGEATDAGTIAGFSTKVIIENMIARTGGLMIDTKVTKITIHKDFSIEETKQETAIDQKMKTMRKSNFNSKNFEQIFNQSKYRETVHDKLMSSG